MGDRWMDERDRDWRERDWRRSEAYGRGEARGRAGETRRYEDRSWAGPEDERGGPYEGRGRRRAYGYEDEDYGGRSGLTAGGAAPSSSTPDRGAGGARFSNQDYTGRGYADERRPPRQGFDYGRAEDYSYARSYRADRDREARRAWQDEGDRSYNRELERRYADDLRRPSAGGRGGYDYDRGYGDAGRTEQAGDFLQRAGQRISSWIRGDAGQEARSHRGVGPKGYQRSDERISDEAHDRLTDDPWLDASNIELVVRAGEITLSGHVESRDAKHRAEHLVEDLSGVRHVQNNLRVDANAGFTGAGRGFGSSAVEAEMRRNEPAPGPEGHAASGLWGRTSTGARAEQSPDPGAKRN